MLASVPQRIRCAATVLAVTALLIAPAAVATAQPADAGPAAGPVTGFWSTVESYLATLFTDWFGGVEPDGAARVRGGNDAGNVGSTLDPDGLTAQDPTVPALPEFEPGGAVGSTLDPDG